MAQIEGGFSLDQFGTTNRISVQTESAITLFDNVAVTQRDQHARALGVYGDVSLGRDLKGRFASFATPKHLLRARQNGCTWNPVSGLRMNVEEFPTCPVVFDGEQCPDVFYGTCFERLFAPGNGVLEMAGTAEGQAVLAAMLRKLYQGLGNSFFDLYNFANHPMITDANAGAFYRVGAQEWADFFAQMTGGDCGGLITLLDELATSGNPYYSEVIPVNDTTGIKASTGEYMGNVVDLFESVKASASADLQIAMEDGFNGQYPVMLVTRSIFNAYKDYIRSLAGTNELAYRFMLENSDGSTRMMKNVLMYDSLPVVLWEANNAFDRITGAQSHRVAITAPGNFGVLHDVDDLAQFDGMGLIVEQSRRVQDKGKIFMTTNFRWGAGIANTDFAVMHSTILHP